MALIYLATTSSSSIRHYRCRLPAHLPFHKYFSLLLSSLPMLAGFQVYYSVFICSSICVSRFLLHMCIHSFVEIYCAYMAPALGSLRRECQAAPFRQESIADLVNVFDELQELLRNFPTADHLLMCGGT